MSGSASVASYRSNLHLASKPERAPRNWRSYVLFACGALSVGGFSSIVVRAADDSGVYEIARQYGTARGTPRFQLPQIFQPAARQTPQRVLSYAPVTSIGLSNYAPSSPKRTSAKSVKISPTPSKDGDQDFEESYLTSRTSFCVRTCDGFYFPVGNADSSGGEAHEAACNRACPGAETAVYVANAGTQGIDDAVTRRGQAYRSLATAYAYRTQYSQACSCNGAPGQARNYSVMSDFTLRSGDLVMSREGLKVFRGAEDQFPHRPKAFASADNAALSANERRWVQAMEASSMRGMQGAKVSTNLQARISSQVKTSFEPDQLKLRGVERTITVTEGKTMRYVGPDVEVKLP